VIEFISNFFKASSLLVSLLFIAHQTISGKLSLGQMAMFLLAFRQGMIYIKDLFSSVAGLYEDSLFIGDTFEFLNLKENITAAEPTIVPQPLSKKITVEIIFPSLIPGITSEQSAMCHLK
jgi:ABC-type multidrug transport system fused ATPase/permease subunit